MKLFARQFAAAALVFCPAVLCAQQSLPAAPSAVAQARGIELATETTFTANVSNQAFATKPTRLNSEQKFNSFIEQSSSPAATFSSAIAAGFRPAWNNSQFNETYASRVGHSIEDQTEQGFFTKFLLPTLLHQDPRYHPATETSRMGRAGYAISRILVGRRDDGRPTLNTSELLGAVMAASITSSYHPVRQYTPGETATRAIAGLGTDAGMNLVREFWPDIKDAVSGHGPKMMQTLVTRLAPRSQTTVTPTN